MQKLEIELERLFIIIMMTMIIIQGQATGFCFSKERYCITFNKNLSSKGLSNLSRYLVFFKTLHCRVSRHSVYKKNSDIKLRGKIILHQNSMTRQL